MNNLNCELYNQPFSHIYIEKEALHHPKTEQILSHFKHSTIIQIDHYKDVFNRAGQSFITQKQSQNLILAIKKQSFLYKGAPVCQDFGYDNFYYTSNIMNCIYDCEYCYLQGMYPSGNIVCFVNLEDFFHEVTQLLENMPLYICISYDTDLLALESITGFVREWIAFAHKHPNLTVELRTKSCNYKSIADITPTNNFILAWTLSPNDIIQQYEHHTPDYAARINSINHAIQDGWTVRLCFDPLLHVKNEIHLYQTWIKQVFQDIKPACIKDVSVGIFRISKEYLKVMRKHRPHSVITQYPYCNDNGVCHYANHISNQLVEEVTRTVAQYIDQTKIFIWKDSDKE